MTSKEMLEKNVLLAYDEPWPSIDLSEPNIGYSNVQVRVKAKDAVKIKRFHHKDNPRYIGVTDIRLLEDFILSNYAYVIE